MSLPNARIPELPELAGASAEDLIIIYQASTGITKYIRADQLLPATQENNFEWVATTSYSINNVVTYNGKWWQSLVNSNQNNIPTEGANWTQVNKPIVARIPPWTAGIYSAHYSSVFDANSIYYLKTSVTLPFNSTTAPSADSTNWQLVGEKVLEIDIQESKFVYKNDTGSANAYLVALTPAITSYNAGLQVLFKATNANTGASTINVNGLGAKAIVDREGVALSGGEIPAGSINYLIYDGTNFQLLSSGGGGGVSTFEKDFEVSPDLDNVIDNYKVVTPVQLSVKLFDGVTTLSYRTKLDDGVDTFVTRADLTALNTYLAGLSDDTEVTIEVTTNATKLTVVRFIEDRS